MRRVPKPFAEVKTDVSLSTFPPFINQRLLSRASGAFTRWIVFAITLTSLVTHGLQARGALDDVANVEVGGNAVHDSNVFRTPNFVAPQADTIYTGIVGLHVNKPYAQQQ